MRDVVYILGSGSKWGDNELRYSLRSVVRHLPHERIFIIGEKPDWIAWNDGIFHIPEVDPYNNKLRNGVWKIRRAAKTAEITEEFVLMNDDFFLLRDIPDVQVFNRGPLWQSIRKHMSKKGYYFEAMKRALVILAEEGVPVPLDYAVHYPVVYEKKKVLELIERLHRHVEHGLLFRTMYGNIFNKGGEERQDVKVRGPKELARRAPDLDMVSTTDELVLKKPFREWIGSVFPEACKYEADGGAGIQAWEDSHKMGPRFAPTVKPFFWNERMYNPGEIIESEVPEKIAKANFIRDLNAES